MAYKPAQHNALSPYLIVDDQPALLAFVQAVLGAEILQQQARPDGSPGHTEVRIDDSVLMCSSTIAGYPARPAMLHLYVPDADACYAKALEAGADSVQEPLDQHGDRTCGVRDGNAIEWWFSTHQGA